MGLFSKAIRLPKGLDTAGLHLIEVPLPKKVVLPLIQCIGEPATPIVSVGDTVKVGQLIATDDKAGSVPLHATISGTISAIGEYLDHKGALPPCVSIEADGADTWLEPQEQEKDPGTLGPAEILERIRGAGLITRGLAATSLSQDLAPLDQPKTHLSLSGTRVVKTIDTLVVAALDQEPSLGVNRYLASTQSDDLGPGIAALKALTGAQNLLIAVDARAGSCPQLEALVKADEQEATKIISLDGRRYPVGLSIPLIKAALGREVALPYGHPRDVGVALYELGTVLAVGASLRKGLPRVTSLISVGGGALAQAGVVQVRIGTPIGQLIESVGGFSKEPAKIIAGGPMTGMAQYDLGVPVTKEIHGVFALAGDEIATVAGYRQCINCGLCVKVCPVNLVPGVLSMYCARDRFELAERQGLLTCIECGCCEYVCPSHRPMVHLFRHAKHQLMEGI